MSSYSKELRRDIIVALCVKAMLIATLVFGYRHLKEDVMPQENSQHNKEEKERYPFFNLTSSKLSTSKENS